MKKTTKSGIIVFILLILFIAGYTSYTVINQNDSSRGNAISSPSNYRIGEKDESYDPVAAKEYKKEFIAALYIEGTIQEENYNYDQKWLMSTIQSLTNNDNNVGLAVFINSPGGAVYQADEVYLALQNYRTTGRPIYVYQGPMAASGGYYISCAAHKIYANRNTLTGCIGVIMGTSFDLTGLFDNLGIKSTTIHSGANKNMMNYNEPFTDEQKKIMQDMCDECYEQFVSIVAKGRGLQYHEAANLSDGRLFTAKQALEAGLIDAIDSWDNMLNDLAITKLKKPGLKVVTYKKPKKKQSMLQILSTKALELENAKAAAKLGLPAEVMKSMNNQNFTPMYLAQ